jgi:hypothetical protein
VLALERQQTIAVRQDHGLFSRTGVEYITPLYIIVPRALAAALASVQLWRIGRRMAVPASVVAYARRSLAEPAAAVGDGLPDQAAVI